MAGKGKFNLRSLVTGEAQLSRFYRGDLEVRTLVDIMTVKTGNIAYRVSTGIPVVQVKGGVGRVALQTGQRLSRGREILQVYQRLVVTGGLYPLAGIFFDQFPGQAAYGDTARSVA